jgi:hypothetical protein
MMNDGTASGRAPAGACVPAGPRTKWPRARFLGVLARDRQFLTVVLIWAACCLGQALYIDAFGASLPWADEWSLTAVASGRDPLTWEWLWRPANEHRMPLTRLVVIGLVRLLASDWQAIHFIDLAFMALGALVLILTARAARGRSATSDAFLCLLPLSPWHFTTLMQYGFAYALAAGLTCLAISLVATRWPVRGVAHLTVYFLLVLAVTFSAGPAGNLWAIGLCGVVVLAMFEGTPTPWKVAGLLGTALVTAASATMLLSIPECPWHAEFRSQSLRETLIAGVKIAVGWLGAPPLQVIWPWALVALVVPGLLVLRRLFRDVAGMLGPERERGATAASRSWWGLGAFLLSTLVVALAMGHGRARYPDLWTSRYLTLIQPIGIVLYLLMVRLRAPVVVPQTLALGMALCVGWCWPIAIGSVQPYRPLQVELERVLRRGTMPLSVVTNQYCLANIVGLLPVHQIYFLEWLHHLREADHSVFRDRRRLSHGRPIPQPQAWDAESGRLSVGLRVVTDLAAVCHRAIEVAADCEGGGTATYQLEVPVAGSYRLCCRMRPSMPGQSLGVKLDNGPLCQTPLADGSDYQPCIFQQPFEMGAGKHDLMIVLPQPGMRLDLLELVPRRIKRRG